MIALGRVPPPFREGGTFHVVVECPAGATDKLVFDPELGAFVYRRALPLGLAYPLPFGFVAGTRADDGDPLDAFVLGLGPVPTGLLVQCRALRVLRLVQRETPRARPTHNDRVIGYPASLRLAPPLRLADLRALASFSEEVGRGTHAEVAADRWEGRRAAERTIRAAIAP